MHTLTLDTSQVADFTDYLSLDGVTLTFDDLDLELLATAHGESGKLSAQGRESRLAVVGPEVEFLGLEGLHELEVDDVTIDASGRIVIHAEVRHGEGEGVEVVVMLDELKAAARQ